MLTKTIEHKEGFFLDNLGLLNDAADLPYSLIIRTKVFIVFRYKRFI